VIAMSRRFWIPLALGSLLALPACSKKTVQQGGLELIIATNLQAPRDYDTIGVVVEQQTTTADGGQPATLFNTTFVVPDQTMLPTTFSIGAGVSPDQVVLIGVAAYKSGQPVALREAELQVPTTRVAELTMILAQSCYGQVQLIAGLPAPTCPMGESCQPAYGKCGPTAIDPSSLPSYSPGDVSIVDASVGSSRDATLGTDSSADAAPGTDEDGYGAPCADPDADPANCGSAGSPCELLYARPAPAGAGTWTQGSLAVDSSNVYFCSYQACDAGNCGSLYKVPSTGGAATHMADLHDCQGVAVGGGNVYWTDCSTCGTGNGSVMTVPVAGGTAASIATGQPNPFAITVDSTSVFWTTVGSGAQGGGASVAMAGFDGGSLQTIFSGVANPQGIAVDATGVYVTDMLLGEVVRIPVGGGDASVFTTQAPSSAGIALGSGSVFWASNNGGGSIQTQPEDGGTARALGGAQIYPFGVAVDTRYVYWTLYNNDGNIGAAPLDGGTPILLATHQHSPRYIAVDFTSVYWTSTCGVVKVAKP
jgi:hypothetical protein